MCCASGVDRRESGWSSHPESRSRHRLVGCSAVELILTRVMNRVRRHEQRYPGLSCTCLLCLGLSCCAVQSVVQGEHGVKSSLDLPAF